MVKKCSTDQSFIQKRDTTNKIGALGAFLKENCIITCLLLLRSLHVKIFGTLLLSCLLSYVNIQIVGYYFQIVFQVILQYLPRKN